jgi:hypothetical protein
LRDLEVEKEIVNTIEKMVEWNGTFLPLAS